MIKAVLYDTKKNIHGTSIDRLIQHASNFKKISFLSLLHDINSKLSLKNKCEREKNGV